MKLVTFKASGASGPSVVVALPASGDFRQQNIRGSFAMDSGFMAIDALGHRMSSVVEGPIDEPSLRDRGLGDERKAQF